jgi:DNA invertase Pin-like site-specific DNA recombinase
MNNNKVTALYCRISREDELADVSSSIETQKTYLTRYANQNKFHNTRVYIDDGYSGANFERPGFLSLKNDIENNDVDTVITKDLSRLGRDYLTTGYYIEHYFPLHGVRYIAINDSVDTEKNENDFAPFRNIMNEWYARDISKKIRSAYKTKALNGEFTGAYSPYGYDKNPDDKHKLIINHRQAKIVRLIFTMYLNGTTLYGISKILKSKRILTPRADLHKTDGVYKTNNVMKYPYDWGSTTLLSILKNEVYIGNIVCNKHQTRSFKSKQLKLNPKSEWIISEHMHEPIIDVDQFHNVQQLMIHKKKTTIVPHENIFKGKLRCSDCGKTMSLSIRPERGYHKSFACSTYRRYTYRCTSHYVSYEYLKEIVKNRINEMIKLSKLGKSGFVTAIKKRKSLNKKIQDLEVFNEESQHRLSEIDELVKCLFEKFVNDKITEDKFYQLDKSYDLEKIELIKNEQDSKKQISKLKSVEEDIETFYDLISSSNEIEELQRDEISQFIEKIVIYEKKDEANKRIVKVFFVLIEYV